MKENKRIWSEMRADFIEENENCIYVDAWTTPNENEEGKTIAKIHMDTYNIEYLDERAKHNQYVTETILFAIFNYICKSHNYELVDRYDDEGNLVKGVDIFNGYEFVITFEPYEQYDDTIRIHGYITQDGDKQKIVAEHFYLDSNERYYSVNEYSLILELLAWLDYLLQNQQIML